MRQGRHCTGRVTKRGPTGLLRRWPARVRLSLRLTASAGASPLSAYAGASVPCAPVRPQARKFALRHAAQALSTRALIGHVRQAGSPERKKRHRGRAREPRKRTREGTICLKYIRKKRKKRKFFFFFYKTERKFSRRKQRCQRGGGLLNAARDDCRLYCDVKSSRESLQ